MGGNLLGIGLVIAAIFLIAGTSAGEQIVSGLSGGTKLTADQIAVLASNAGFTGDDLQTAISIALAESGGNPGARGDLNLGVSVGLWQINVKAHPEFAGQDLTDPQTNANAAYSVYQAAGYSFRPWSTFKGGQYEAFSNTALQGMNDAGLLS